MIPRIYPFLSHVFFGLSVEPVPQPFATMFALYKDAKKKGGSEKEWCELFALVQQAATAEPGDRRDLLDKIGDAEHSLLGSCKIIWELFPEIYEEEQGK